MTTRKTKTTYELTTPAGDIVVCATEDEALAKWDELGAICGLRVETAPGGHRNLTEL